MKFIIDRRTWWRGKGREESRLLRKDGMKCCVGFMAQQAGVPDSEIINRSTLSRAQADTPALSWIAGGPYPSFLYMINDNKRVSDIKRERRIQQEGQKQGHSIVFVSGAFGWWWENFKKKALLIFG